MGARGWRPSSGSMCAAGGGCKHYRTGGPVPRDLAPSDKSFRCGGAPPTRRGRRRELLAPAPAVSGNFGDVEQEVAADVDHTDEHIVATGGARRVRAVDGRRAALPRQLVLCICESRLGPEGPLLGVEGNRRGIDGPGAQAASDGLGVEVHVDQQRDRKIYGDDPEGSEGLPGEPPQEPAQSFLDRWLSGRASWRHW
jgi:hypothetical protein